MTEKQKKFADEYLVDLNATRAYKKAYTTVKNDVVAATNGARLLRNAQVSAYIAKRLQELESERVADMQEVMEYLTSVMRREKKEHVVVTVTQEKSSYIRGDDGKMRRQTVKQEVPKVVEIPTRISDANKAAELLGKRYALFTEKVEMDTDMSLDIHIDYGDDSQ